MEEVWKNIPNYEGLYQASNFGRIKRTKTNKILNPQIHKGYCEVNLSKNGIVKHYRVHILIALAFLPNLENKQEVNHIDGNKQNNCVSNLEWATHKENMSHAFNNGLISKEGKQRIINGLKKSTNERKKPILQLKNGIVIKEYESYNQAVKESKITHIYNVLKGNRKYAGGFEWRYK